MEEQNRLEEAYESGYLQRGHSEKVDRAMLDVMDLEETGHVRENVFQEKWGIFTKIVVEEFPNLSPQNFASLELFLTSQRFFQERLLVARLQAEITPNSTEAQCFLGHAYKDVGDHLQAIERYSKAYELAMNIINTRELAHRNPLWLDASDFLRYRAQSELVLTRHADALVSATTALEIARRHGAMWKAPTIYEVLGSIVKAMGLMDLAHEYEDQARSTPGSSESER